ncbi:MAG TPA: hypothetical protein VK494_09230, partial [Gemmatimonadaceae bacterium]|nr:hypothetical protein [Gemmatimonadaceae bacterium]
MTREEKNCTDLSRRAFHSLAIMLAATFVACGKTDGRNTGTDTGTAASAMAASSTVCASDNGGITLPSGFCAAVFADTIGHARHIVVSSNGDVYVNTWSGNYFNTPAHPGGFLVALRDTNNDGKADIVRRFGPDSLHGNGGGTGIGIY